MKEGRRWLWYNGQSGAFEIHVTVLAMNLTDISWRKIDPNLQCSHFLVTFCIVLTNSNQLRVSTQLGHIAGDVQIQPHKLFMTCYHVLNCIGHCNLFLVSLQLMYRSIYEVCLIVWHLSLYVMSPQFAYACFLMEVRSVNSKAFRFRLWEERDELHLQPLKPHVKKSLWVWHKKLGKTIDY